MGYRVINGKVVSIGEFPYEATKTKKITENKSDFDSVLKEQLGKQQSFVISNHAAERLKDRNISLNESDMMKINEGINKASEKGASDSLLLYKDVVLVASIKNRTIITAMDKDSSKGNVFTNIDSVVLL